MHEDDVRGNALAGKRVAVIGFGSQGHAHAQNMADSGCDVVVGLREGSASRAAAEEAGLRVTSVGEAVAQGDVVMVLIPDELQADVYEREIKPNLKPGTYLAFAHGFAIHFKRIVPPEDVNVFLVAPKGPGHLVRWQYEAGAGVPCLIAVHQDPAGDTREVALSYACAIGGGRAGILETSFREETETDLFGEQAVLCGGLTELIRAGFETLVEAGYAPEMAYFECLHEVKLITDLVHERGITGMRDSISNTAEYGDITRGRKVIGAEARQAMKTILADIQSGSFAAEWVAECDAGKPRMTELAAKDAQHPVEQIGREIRAMMPWLQVKRGKAAGAAPRPSGEQATTSAAPNAEHAPATPSSGGSSRLPRPAGARTSSAQSPRAHAGPAADPSHGWPGFEDPPCWYLRPRSTDGRG